MLIINIYNGEEMSFQEVEGPWIDAGTFDSLYEATTQIRNYREWKKNDNHIKKESYSKF